MKQRQSTCPCCGSRVVTQFYTQQNVPVHSVMKIRDRQSALDFPRGTIHLGFCESCGFIFNRAFEPQKLSYSPECEESQGFSAIFSRFHRQLARDLIDRYDLHGKDIIEIGCGKGEFLYLLCSLGGNLGIGFDPAYTQGRFPDQENLSLTFIKDYYSQKYAGISANFYCCKMTLEHIPDVFNFMQVVRSAVGDQADKIVFFQVPDVARILEEVAFWDIYYEHCSYFSFGSLVRLFRSTGFEVINLWRGYDDQYLMIEARPGSGQATQLAVEDDLISMKESVCFFKQKQKDLKKAWTSVLSSLKAEGMSVILWGGGSKAVSFLANLPVNDAISFVVDVNPYKSHTYIAGTGHEIITPEELVLPEHCPDVVIVMNPVYIPEIQEQLSRMKIHPQVLTVQAPEFG